MHEEVGEMGEEGWTSIRPLQTFLESMYAYALGPVVVTGDFNLHDALWNDSSYHHHHRKSAELISIMTDAGLTLRTPPGTPTF